MLYSLKDKKLYMPCEEFEEAIVFLYTISSSAANPNQNLMGSLCSIVELVSVLLILHSKKHAFTDVGKICCGWGSLQAVPPNGKTTKLLLTTNWRIS
jgi:hypothetical protein